MGLFGNNWSTPGPGVSKNEPEKKRFFLFLDLLGRKFSKLIFLNLIYFITILPLAFGIIFSVGFHPQIVSDGSLIYENLGKYPLFVFTGDIIGLILIFISLFITGPATCGFTYVLRNMQRQEHTWVWSDFIEHFTKNFKQGIIIGILDIVISILLYFAFHFYAYALPVINPQSALISSIGKYAVVFIAFIFLSMHYYLYVMTVTFDLKIKDIIKNAAIFAFAKLPLNLFLTILIFVIVAISILYIGPGVICAIVFTLSFIGFMVVFSTYPTIEKYMIISQKSNDENIDFESDFQD